MLKLRIPRYRFLDEAIESISSQLGLEDFELKYCNTCTKFVNGCESIEKGICCEHKYYIKNMELWDDFLAENPIVVNNIIL